MKPYRFPSVSALRSALCAEWRGLRRTCSPSDLADPYDSDATIGTDVRLQVTERGWNTHSGSSDYDQDHRGAWGASFLPYARTNLTDLARELLDDARESHAQILDGEQWRKEQAEKRALMGAGLHPSQTGARP